MIRYCPKCGHEMTAESIGWKCRACCGFVDMQGDFHEQKEKPFMPPHTNADRIRAMSDEELANAIYELTDKLQTGTLNDLSDLFCDGKNGCIDKDGNVTCNPDMEKACVLRWLRSPAKVDDL